MKVWVVTYNDGGHGSAVWVEGVFATEESARAHCEEQNASSAEQYLADEWELQP